MSLDIVKKNSNSPFQLQRSMVPQGGEGGAYESGGYTGQSAYSDGGVAASIAGMGQMLGAAISSRTAADDNASDVKKKERLDKRAVRLTEKMTSSKDPNQAARIENRLGNIGKKQQETSARIKAYNEIEKPTLKSGIGDKAPLVTVNSKVTTEPPVASVDFTSTVKKLFNRPQ
jgi:hypothetical protein